MDIQMILIQCADCGIPFAITADKDERLRECHNDFYCPMGHVQSYKGKSTVEKLRDEVVTLSKKLIASNDELDKLKKKIGTKKRR